MVMYNIAKYLFYIGNMNVNLIDRCQWLPIFPALVRANCKIGIMGSRRVRDPRSFRNLSGIAFMRFRCLPSAPQGDSFRRHSRRGRKTSTRDVFGVRAR